MRLRIAWIAFSRASCGLRSRGRAFAAARPLVRVGVRSGRGDSTASVGRFVFSRVATPTHSCRIPASMFLGRFIHALCCADFAAASDGRSLFSAHMVQHELLMLVAAPLLVLADRR